MLHDATRSREERRDAQRPSWIDRLWSIRDGLIGNERFQRWASRFPPTRLIARRQARTAFDLCAGFVYSQVLAACVELDLLRGILLRPATAADLAKRHFVPLAAMERLLAAAGPLGLVARRSGDRWGLGMVGAAIVGTPGLAEMIKHHRLLYADLADPVALLRGEQTKTNLAAYWPYAAKGEPASLKALHVRSYSALMTISQGMISRDIVDAYPLGRHRKLLDVGGGEGAFVEAVARAVPSLEVALFDLPAVADRARVRLGGSDLAGRVDICGGDFFVDHLPSDADIISLVRVIHDHDDTAALELFSNVRRALRPGGRLLLAEPMSETPGAETVGDTYFGFYLLAMGAGRTRTPRALMQMLDVAGFARSRLLRTSRPILVRAILAEA